MSELSTRSIFTFKKDEAANKFLDSTKQLRDTLASKCFTNAPGVLFSLSADIQGEYKHNLDASVLALMEQQIEREMRVLGVKNTVEYRTAAMAFEIEKHNLLNGLTQELALLHKEEGRLDAVIEHFLVETQLRQVVIIEAQAANEKERQSLLQQKTEAERLSFDKELEYVNAQLAYAIKRNELIPIINRVIEAQQKVVAAESGPMHQALADLLAAKQNLAEAKKGLLQPLLDKAEAILAYANKQELVIPYLLSKGTLSKQLANAQSDIVYNHQIPAVDARIAFVSAQVGSLSYLNNVANLRSELASHEADAAEKMIDKAEADYDLAKAELSISGLYEERANKLISVLLPSQKNLISAIKRDVEYRKEASKHRITAARNEVEIARFSSKGFVQNAQADVASTQVQIAKLEYTTTEKEFEAGYFVDDANNISQLAADTNTAMARKISYVDQASSSENEMLIEAQQYRFDRKSESVENTSSAEISALETSNTSELRRIERLAYYQQNAEITVGLSHAISAGGTGKKQGNS